MLMHHGENIKGPLVFLSFHFQRVDRVDTRLFEDFNEVTFFVDDPSRSVWPLNADEESFHGWVLLDGDVSIHGDGSLINLVGDFDVDQSWDFNGTVGPRLLL